MSVSPVPPLDTDNVPDVIFAASKLGIRAPSNAPVVIFAASKLGIRDPSNVPDVIFAVSKLGIRAPSITPVVIFAASKLGIRDPSNIPVVIFAASKSGISELMSELYESAPFPPDVFTNPFSVVSNLVAFVAVSAFPSKSATNTPFVPD